MTKISLKKKDLINILNNKTGLSKNLSKKIIEDLINILILAIKNKDLNLKNIGKFNKIYKKERMGRNPKTNETFIISSRFSVRFTPSRKLLSSINNGL